MTNRLKKTTRSIVVPEQAARAAIPYRPAQPSYYSVETNIECSTITTLVGARPPAIVSFIDYATDPPSIGYRLDPGDPGTYIYTTDCKPVTRVVFHPAVPEQKAQAAVDYRPQTVVQEFGLGWNAGARSIAELPGNGAATFKITSAVGVVVGFNDVNDGVGYVDIEHGIYFRRESFRIIEKGIQKGSESSFSATDVFKIARIGGRVRYYQNDTLIYTSLEPSYGTVFLDASMYSGGDTIESPAMLAVAGGYSHTSMLPLDGYAGATRSYSRGKMHPLIGEASALKARANNRMRPLTGMAAQGKYGASFGAMRPLTGFASAGMIASGYALSAGQMMPLYGYAYGPEGRYGSSSAIMVPLTGLAVEGEYGESRGAMAALRGVAADRSYLQLPQARLPLPTLGGLAGARAPQMIMLERFSVNARAAPSDQNVAQMSGPAASLGAWSGGTLRANLPSVMLDAGATTTLLATAQLTAPACNLTATGTTSLMAQGQLVSPSAFELAGYAGALVSATVGAGTLLAAGTSGVAGAAQLTLPLYELNASATLEAVAQAELTSPALAATPWAVAWMASSPATLTAIGTAVVAVTHEAYAVNLRSERDGGGNEVTRYTNFPFERIVRWRGSYYGMAADGLYLLEGTTDDGQPIEWVLRTGTTDFGKSEKKNTASAYVGGRLGPATTFTVLTGEKLDSSYDYTTPRGATAQNYRQKFGRGLDARYYAFQLAGSGELELDDITFEVVPRTRRI